MLNPVRRVVVAAEPQGELAALKRLIGRLFELRADALAITGNLLSSKAGGEEFAQFFETLAESSVPTYFVPGPEDVPMSAYLREAANIETVAPHLHGVHGTFAIAPGFVVFAGFGGEVTDDPEALRKEDGRLFYPAWEVEYRFKFLRELKDYPKVFLFHSAPEHKGLGEQGSAVLAELIKTHQPRLVLIGGKAPREEVLGTARVVGPGSLAEGHFAVVSLRGNQVEHHQLD
ncbi:MAG: heat-stable protein [Candidatus Poribacteria bacterium]|nr:MAG: heat-stable protein [Candidatus Poribacteria bacterium]